MDKLRKQRIILPLLDHVLQLTSSSLTYLPVHDIPKWSITTYKQY